MGGAREGGGMRSGRGQGGWGDEEWEGPGRVGGCGVGGAREGGGDAEWEGPGRVGG